MPQEGKDPQFQHPESRGLSYPLATKFRLMAKVTVRLPRR